MGCAIGRTPTPLFVWRYPYRYRTQEREGIEGSHCEAAVVRAVEEVPGVEKAKASASDNTLTIKGSAIEETIRAAVEGIGYTFKGKA
jgi:copper chaperone CopZ